LGPLCASLRFRSPAPSGEAIETNLVHVAISVKRGGLVSAFMRALAGIAPGHRLKKFSGDVPYSETLRVDSVCQRSRSCGTCGS
jgi:hypothetical protein